MKDLSGYIDILLDDVTTSEDVDRRVYLKEETHIIEYTFYTNKYDIGYEDFLRLIVKEQVDKVIDQYITKGSLEYLIVVNFEPLHTKL
jgi:hypothetical protein